MNLFQRQQKIARLSLQLEDFIENELNITQVFRYTSLSAVTNYIARCALDEPIEFDVKTQCLIAMAYCANQLPEIRNDVESLALFMITEASHQYPGLNPVISRVPSGKHCQSMLKSHPQL